MKLLDRYIAKSVLAAIMLITLMLAGLQVFILFVNQLDSLGKANYGIWQAALFVMLQMPYQVYLFFPMASLLGCLIGLGVLANHSELVVMRAAGMSVGQITLAVLKVALLIILVVTLLGETIVPRLAHWARDEKMQALNGGQTLRTGKGVWLRYQNDFITIGSILPNNILLDVVQFHFDESHHLRLVRKMKEVRYEQGGWQGYEVAQTTLSDSHTTAQNVATLPWDVALNPRILSISTDEPDEMTLHELHRYLRVQKKNQLAVQNYQLAFLQRLIQPLTTVVMMLLAIPFIFGPLRSSTMGSKLVTGATVGFGFHIINRFFGPISQVLQWPPEIAAIGPTVIFACIGLYMMRSVR